MSAALAGALLAGLLGSPHCAGMCGGFAVSVSERPQDAVAWHLGRLSTYAGLGALAGLGGAALPGPGWVLSAVSIALLVWFSARLAGLVPEGHLRVPGLARLGARWMREPGVAGRYAFGLSTGLLPCGLVYAALGLPVALAHPGWGAAAMLAFGLGTIPVLAAAAVGLRGLAGRRPWVRRALAAGVLAAGLWSIHARSAPPPGLQPPAEVRP